MSKVLSISELVKRAQAPKPEPKAEFSAPKARKGRKERAKQAALNTHIPYDGYKGRDKVKHSSSPSDPLRLALSGTVHTNLATAAYRGKAGAGLARGAAFTARFEPPRLRQEPSEAIPLTSADEQILAFQASIRVYRETSLKYLDKDYKKLRENFPLEWERNNPSQSKG